MVSLASPPSMELCNDLLRLQGKKNRVDGMFATLDVRLFYVCVYMDTHIYVYNIVCFYVYLYICDLPKCFGVDVFSTRQVHDRLTDRSTIIQHNHNTQQLMREAGLHPDTDSYQHLGT